MRPHEAGKRGKRVGKSRDGQRVPFAIASHLVPRPGARHRSFAAPPVDLLVSPGKNCPWDPTQLSLWEFPRQSRQKNKTPAQIFWAAFAGIFANTLELALEEEIANSTLPPKIGSPARGKKRAGRSNAERRLLEVRSNAAHDPAHSHAHTVAPRRHSSHPELAWPVPPVQATASGDEQHYYERRRRGDRNGVGPSGRYRHDAADAAAHGLSRE